MCAGLCFFNLTINVRSYSIRTMKNTGLMMRGHRVLFHSKDVLMCNTRKCSGRGQITVGQLVQRPTSFPLLSHLSGVSQETSSDLILLFPFLYLALKTMYITGMLGQLSHSGGNTFAYQKGAQPSREKMSFPPVFLSLPSLSRLEKHCFHSVSFAVSRGV